LRDAHIVNTDKGPQRRARGGTTFVDDHDFDRFEPITETGGPGAVAIFSPAQPTQILGVNAIVDVKKIGISASQIDPDRF
jgi:hypothetical protein